MKAVTPVIALVMLLLITVGSVGISYAWFGGVNIQPRQSGLVINYPGMEGRHTIRVGTSSTVAENTVVCS